MFAPTILTSSSSTPIFVWSRWPPLPWWLPRLDEKEELDAGHHDARLGGEVDDVHDGGAVNVLLEDEKLIGVVDAARVVVGHGEDRGLRCRGRVRGPRGDPHRRVKVF
ncbi:hypothetical protein GUJ93_ZPchr0005g15546 [Zizania palustris]|uniref:Uncharacterized protein n=1 Tax=Zizania palustris TaxID=103762 RepID=A0A8J5W0Z2_ZIZPA|nr:hypothetical protein GUJ93_ZPchr0005g15546 [Zizania palustris]